MIDFNKIEGVYFLGIGGIGMSALARYFLAAGKFVAGYDRHSSGLTRKLEEEGAIIHYTDTVSEIPSAFRDKNKKDTLLIVYTPAVPKDHSERIYFTENGFRIIKRSELLGIITSGKTTIAIAGTHGKTTISTMVAHILTKTGFGCNAILGGISRNYNTNLLLNSGSNTIVTEADEYDRSFLRLFPEFAVISAMDADHLDVYGTYEELKDSFRCFASQVKTGLLVKKGLEFNLTGDKNTSIVTYSREELADYYAVNIYLREGLYAFDLVTPQGELKGIQLGQPGLYNVENAVAALAVSHMAGVSLKLLRDTLIDFRGIQRRFDVHLNSEGMVFIDDYAHHPEEIAACIDSVRQLFPGRKITGVFQPHLYSRTKDLADGFAKSLSLLDSLILLDIYPARELPIEGVNSEMIFNQVQIKEKLLCSREDLPDILRQKKPDVLITMGAGNIDEYVETIKNMFN